MDYQFVTRIRSLQVIPSIIPINPINKSIQRIDNLITKEYIKFIS